MVEIDPKKVKRMRYFDGLFLKQEEFNLEQNYHIRMRRLHNRHLHGWGIVWGLDVAKKDPTTVTIKEGMALDRVKAKSYDGIYEEDVSQEIVLTKDTDVNLSSSTNNYEYIFISYHQEESDVVEEKGGDKKIHWSESALIEHGDKPGGEEKIILAKVVLKDNADKTGKIVDSIVYSEGNISLRTYAGAYGRLTLPNEKDSSNLPYIEGMRSGSLNGIQVNSSITDFTGALTIEGNVGIGTTNPSERLEISGNLKIPNDLLSFGAKTRQMINLWNANYGIGIQASTQYYRSAKNFAWYIGGVHNDSELNAGGGTAAMVIKQGNIGIGTAAPGERLEVNGTVKAAAFAGDGSKLTGINTSQWSDAPGGIYYNKGNVGIGTPSPGFRFHHVGGDHVIEDSDISFRRNEKHRWKIQELQNTGFRITQVYDNADKLLNLARFEISDAGNVGISGDLNIHNDFLSFGTKTRQMVNLWSTNYGIGIQSSTQYYRSAKNFAWYIGGVHNDGELNTGGGTAAMVIKQGSVGIGTTAPNVRLAINGNGANVYATDVWVENNIHVQGNEELAQGGRGKLRIGTAWHYVGLYSEASSTGKPNDLVLGASSKTVRVGPDNAANNLFVSGNMTIAGEIIQDDWIAPALENGWQKYDAIYNPPGYFRDKNGIIHLRGMVKMGGIGTSIFTLPKGYRPEYRELQPVQTNPNAIGRCDISPDGKIIATSGNNGWFSLDGITFLAKKEVILRPIPIDPIPIDSIRIDPIPVIR